MKLIYEDAAIEAVRKALSEYNGEYDCRSRYGVIADSIENLKNLPPAQPEDWMERNKERILQAGMEGREIEFRIGGRLFAIRELAQ